ncbi:MAG: FGGY-family carbohydrate kinase [Desulfobacterales bacterium]|nr:FGGY-family carbohydrate kinase [Desulfobacterales bacterium]
MDDKYIIAIDHGTSGIKAAIVSAIGKIIDFEYEKTPIYFSNGGGAEQDPNDWWNALINTSKKLVQKGSVESKDITSICVSSTFSSTVFVDKNGSHLMNAITWMDTRGAKYISDVIKGFPIFQGYGLLNLLRWVLKTAGAPSLSGKDDIAHVLLVKHAFPEVYKNTFMCLPSKDFLNLKLTGKFKASYDSIHLFWVTDIRDINNIQYDYDLINRLKIDPEKLPPLMNSTDILGTISHDVAEEIGISPETKVVMGSPDHQAACIGSGAVRDYEGHIYIGTSSWVQCIIPFKKTDPIHSIASFPTSIPGKYQSVNEQDIAGGVLSFLMDNVIYHKNRLLSGTPPENPYKYLDEIASEVPAGSHKLIFTPWLNGERTPVDDSHLRGGLYNISKTTNQDHIVRSFLEGVAYNTRWSLNYVEKFIKRKMDTLNIVGGGAKSDVWCQIFADVLNRNIRQVKHPMQANARGAAWIAAVGLGYISFDDIPKLIQYQNTYTPNPKNRKIYDELFYEFIGIHKRNKAMFHRLNK